MADSIKYEKAAGIKIPRRPPGRPVSHRPEKSELERLYVKEGRSIRDTAAQLKCSKDLIVRALKEYGIKARPRIGHRQSQLTKYRLKDLKASVKKQGIRATARDLKVSEGTLRHYLKMVKQEREKSGKIDA